MGVILYGVLLAHLVAYKEQYTNIGLTFVATVIIRILAKKTGDKDNADLVSLGGSALTVGEFAKLLKKVSESSFDGAAGTGSSGKGAILKSFETIYGPIMDTIKQLMDKK